MKGLILCAALLALSGGLAKAGSITFKNEDTDRSWVCGWSGQTETEILKVEASQDYELQEETVDTYCTSQDMDKIKLSCPTVNTDTDTTITIRQKDHKGTAESYTCKY